MLKATTPRERRLLSIAKRYIRLLRLPKDQRIKRRDEIDETLREYYQLSGWASVN